MSLTCLFSSFFKELVFLYRSVDYFTVNCLHFVFVQRYLQLCFVLLGQTLNVRCQCE